jgi:hypothetical protein
VKTIAILTAALAISLACAGTASAQTSSVTQTTSTDGFGNQRTVTKRHNADGSESVTKSVSDGFGDRKSITKRHNADGSESVTKSVSDAFGNRKSVTKRENADGSESITFTKTKGRNTF